MKMADPRSGHYRQNGRGSTAYDSFVPVPLQQVELSGIDELSQLADKAMALLRKRNAEGQDKSQDEAESSVNLAWNVPPLLLLASNDETATKIKADQTNLLKALDYGISHLQVLPLSGRIIKDMHWLAMQGEYNEKSYPGEFRTSPVWIGTEDDTLATAPFVPPSPTDMLAAFYDLEQFINAPDHLHPLIKASLIHYQFEAIHPFIDGNGRIGRLLTLLFLVDRGILHGCTVNLSRAFHLRQFQYYSGIASVEVSGCYEKWVRFFLNALSMA